MKHLKHGIALLVVLTALFVASLGATFTENPSGVSIESTYQVTKDGDYLIGATGLHW
jgi:hypothetical protein